MHEYELSGGAVAIAQNILGAILIRKFEGKVLSGRIVETEAYDQTDQASHTFRGMTPCNNVMFGPPGSAYVYFTYGMHYCFNIVVGDAGFGAAVLVRALEPLEGIEHMQQHRPKAEFIHQLTNGPAKLCEAFMIGADFNGHNLRKPPLQLAHGTLRQGEKVVQTTRIGIKKDVDRPWRFYIRDNLFVSRFG